MRVGALLVLAALASGACCLPARELRRGVCADGWPVKLLLDPRCRRGVCGFTCAPERWQSAL